MWITKCSLSRPQSLMSVLLTTIYYHCVRLTAFQPHLYNYHASVLPFNHYNVGKVIPYLRHESPWRFTYLSRMSSVKKENTKDTVSKDINSPNTDSITKVDQKYISMALEYAKLGKGFTFPNPAVGCVIVKSKTGTPNEEEDMIIGSGFHPKAGMPHAEIFALLQACGSVQDGVEAATSVLPNHISSNPTTLQKKVQDLLQVYLSENGSQTLFGSHLMIGGDKQENTVITAYVTLEPCCHTGKRTPPCTMALVHAGVGRVVVGFRDPNPRVDGGGVMYLRSKNIQVDVLPEEMIEAKACQLIVDNFIKRVQQPKINYDETMNGAYRSALRSLAGRKKSDKTLVEKTLRRQHGRIDLEVDWSNTQNSLETIVPVKWLEEVDSELWKHELVLLRLGEVAPKKKLALLAGKCIAEALNAHVTQVVGHTVLLYRPGTPPTINLNELIAVSNTTATT